MSSHLLSISRRLRKTHFTNKVIQSGVKAFTVYNHMLLPTIFESVEEDYHHLKKEVQVWDVSCERQVEIKGPDAKQIVQKIIPRDISLLTQSKCLYTPLVNSKGGMINDPVIIKLSEDRYWISIADSDALLWIDGIATGLKLEVTVFEPDVSPLAIQGPKSKELLRRVFGANIEKLKFFEVGIFYFNGLPLITARSGFSKQSGYEIYVSGPDIADKLWDSLFEAGKDLNVRAGCPNLIERTEAGLLSYGNDMDLSNTPFECGLGKFLPKLIPNNCIGAQKLNCETTRSPNKTIKSLSIDCYEKVYCDGIWELFDSTNKNSGQVTSAAYSPDFQKVVALGMVSSNTLKLGQNLYTVIHGKRYQVKVEDQPFI